MIYFFSLVVGFFLYLVLLYSSLPVFNDFYSYYIAGYLIRHNLPIYGVTDAFIQFVKQNHFQFTWGTGYSYPPLFAQLMFPFSLLPFPAAAAIWASIQILLYGLFIKHIVESIPLRRSMLILPILLFFGPALGSIVNGQINIIILWCLYFYFYSKNELLRVVSLCFAGWVKVFPFLLLVKDIIQKKMKFVILFMPICLIFLLFQSISNSGSYIVDYFMKILPKLQTGFDPFITNQSIVGVVSRFIGEPFNTNLVTIGEGIIFLILVLLTFTKGKTHAKEIDLLWLLTILLCAGKNSYWNMTPALFIYLYFFKVNKPIDVKTKGILVLSAVLSICFPYIIFVYMKYPLLFSSIGGRIYSSLGFFSLLILYYPLLKSVFKINK